MSLLQVSNLDVTFATQSGPVQAVSSLRFALKTRETLGLVGESGSGKSQAVMAMLGLLAENGRAEGSVKLDDMEILNRSERTLNTVRGRRIAMIFQDPMTSLNPYVRIGTQLTQVLIQHRGLDFAAAKSEVLRMLDAVRLPHAERRLSAHPHEFSGGMRQRVMIAAALLCRPEVLVADEPTTALDVTVQANILALLNELKDTFGMAVILISHDLGVIAGNCERMIVLQDGVVREEGLTPDVFANPQHEYTQKLIAAVPRLDHPVAARRQRGDTDKPVLTIDDLFVRFELPRRKLFESRESFLAVNNVSVRVRPGETLGVVGESGCGKSTLARAIMQLLEPQSGSIALFGTDLCGKPVRELRRHRRDLQMVFQDPLASLNPRMTFAEIIAEPLRVHEPQMTAAQRTAAVEQMLPRVGLDADMMHRYPHEYSGGQCQRAGIARALITKPSMLICDEAVSALDVSVQSGIIDLIISLQRELGLAVIFIAHDLAVVRRVSHRVMVMYLGRAIEIAPATTLYHRPLHPYTRSLLDAVPVPDPVIEASRERSSAGGEIPAPWSPPSGCTYRTRCAFAQPACAGSIPVLETLADGRRIACHRYAELDLTQQAQHGAGQSLAD